MTSYFSNFTIENYRSFSETQTLNFAIPNKIKEGSGITYIVGENNSGKTTVLEGLTLSADRKIRSSEKKDQPLLLKLYDQNNQLKKCLSLLRSASYTLREDPKLSEEFSFQIIPSRRHWTSQLSGTIQIDSYLSKPNNIDLRKANSPSYTSSILKEIEKDSPLYEQFIIYVRNIIPSFVSFSLGYEEHEYIEYRTKEGLKHKSDFFGDGIISILHILSHLFFGKPNALIIDEPELSLHPQAQKKLLLLIAEASKKRQIILSTHSPYFVSWEYIRNGAVLNRVCKFEDRISQIYTLKEYIQYEKLLNGANWQQPFLMDVVAKEIFFHDNFLFLEGQEDVGLLLSEENLNKNINLFGYGVRGTGAFKFALQLAKDLGIKKAGVILDGGEKEKRIKEELEGVYPEYKIIQWDRNDIRDKEKDGQLIKTGYFDKNGKKKDHDDLGDYPHKIEQINKYFFDT